jgi:phenylpropionate dioxygenase-like ring-hydroxylating dioxygenase large terminal subunit
MMATVSDTVRALVDQMEQSTRPLAEARALPPACYTAEEFFAFEKEAIFARTWLCLGHQNQIPNPGDYFTITVIDEPLLVVRDHDGAIRVLSAVCQHRGHPVATGHGTCTQFRCPYHSWAYALGGELLAAPEMDRTVPLAELRREVRLPALRVELWHGFIFANLDPDAAPLGPTLAKLDRELAGYDVERMAVMPSVDVPDLAWNWKITHENALEPYHTQFVHKGYHEMAPASMATFIEWDPDDGQIMHPTYFRELDGGLNPTGKALFPIIEGLTEEQRRRTIFASVPPTLFLSLKPDQVFTFLVLPQAVDRLTLRINFYFPESTTKMRTFRWAYQTQIACTKTFGEQDGATNANLQRGMRSRFAPRGRYCHQEATLPQFSRWLVRRYRAGLEAAAPGVGAGRAGNGR